MMFWYASNNVISLVASSNVRFETHLEIGSNVAFMK